MKSIRLSQTRPYFGHHDLLRIANYRLHETKNDPRGGYDDLHQALLYSALALEAFLNGCGYRLFREKWKKHERKSTLEKLKLVADELKIVLKKNRHSWSSVRELIELRNMIVHVQPEDVTVTHHLTKEEYQEFDRSAWPKSTLDKMITIETAERFLRCVHIIKRCFIRKMPYDLRDGLDHDSWSGSTSTISDE